MEENLVLRLEGGCGSNTHGAVRHLAISSNWEGDEIEFQRVVELSRIRSLTVFGKWRPFYVSAEMRFLRVLDLENTGGLANQDLDHIGKLLHLRYLSLRGCFNITYLPDSVGNLSQLETLDIKDTEIAMLPKTIIKLSKLRYIHASFGYAWGDVLHCCRKCLILLLTLFSLCSVCCLRDFKEEINEQIGSTRRRDACAFVCCTLVPGLVTDPNTGGVMVPRGTKRLKALCTLRYVNLNWGNDAIQEIKGLTALRKLGVVGINKKNGPGFCSAVSGLSHLESLSVQSRDGLIGCLDGISRAPENLQSLKLSGSLENLPAWINRLQNLVKLRLLLSSLSCNSAAMHALGNLPNLSILSLWENNLKIDVLQFQSGLFSRLTVLDLQYNSMEIKLVEFEEGSMPNLHVLNLYLYWTETAFSGLELLESIKEVCLSFNFPLSSTEFPEDMDLEERAKEAAKKAKVLKDNLRIQLDRNKNRPVLKVN